VPAKQRRWRHDQATAPRPVAEAERALRSVRGLTR
jgi:hypothetical protein